MKCPCVVRAILRGARRWRLCRGKGEDFDGGAVLRLRFEPLERFQIVVPKVGLASEMRTRLRSPAGNAGVSSSAFSKARRRFVPPPSVELRMKLSACSIVSGVAASGVDERAFASSLKRTRLKRSSGVRPWRKKSTVRTHARAFRRTSKASVEEQDDVALGLRGLASCWCWISRCWLKTALASK